MKLIIQNISVDQLLPLRGKILRPGQPRETWSFAKDHDRQTFHLGAFLNGALVGVATFEMGQHHQIPAKKSYRLRGMAVETSYQRHGIGRQLVEKGLAILLEKEADLLWFNAREKAFSFYESLGFSYHGELFDIEQIGPHKVMYKYLK
jgi:GNAT superfamily N-acetyltransferase